MKISSSLPPMFQKTGEALRESAMQNNLAQECARAHFASTDTDLFYFGENGAKISAYNMPKEKRGQLHKLTSIFSGFRTVTPFYPVFMAIARDRMMGQRCGFPEVSESRDHDLLFCEAALGISLRNFLNSGEMDEYSVHEKVEVFNQILVQVIGLLFETSKSISDTFKEGPKTLSFAHNNISLDHLTVDCLEEDVEVYVGENNHIKTRYVVKANFLGDVELLETSVSSSFYGVTRDIDRFLREVISDQEIGSEYRSRAMQIWSLLFGKPLESESITKITFNGDLVGLFSTYSVVKAERVKFVKPRGDDTSLINCAFLHFDKMHRESLIIQEACKEFSDVFTATMKTKSRDVSVQDDDYEEQYSGEEEDEEQNDKERLDEEQVYERDGLSLRPLFREVLEYGKFINRGEKVKAIADLFDRDPDLFMVIYIALRDRLKDMNLVIILVVTNLILRFSSEKLDDDNIDRVILLSRFIEDLKRRTQVSKVSEHRYFVMERALIRGENIAQGLNSLM